MHLKMLSVKWLPFCPGVEELTLSLGKMDTILHFVPKGPMNRKPTLVQIMAWLRRGTKSLSEQMLTHIYDL